MSKKKKTQTSQVVKPTKIETWDCKCGKKKITSPFCPNCGKKCKTGGVSTNTAPKRLSKGALIAIIATSVILVAALIVGVVFMTRPANRDSEEKATLLSFAQATSLETMRELDGKKVTIVGYMSTLSPVDGSFMYLMNLPYQSCPFCIPNTTTLSNTLAVYAKSGEEFEFTDRAIQVTGTLEFGSWKDAFGYQYEYRIKDAIFTVVSSEDMSDELKLWQSLASADVIGEVYTLYSVASYLCFWPEYVTTYNSQNDYLKPEDVKKDFAQGGSYAEFLDKMYYDDLIIRIEAVDPNAFSDLVSNIRKIQTFILDVNKDLQDGKYIKVPEYTNAFLDGREQYKYERYTEFTNVFDNLYYEFAMWMSKWEV